MNNSKESLSHTRWECKYHVVFIPKYRKKSIYGWVRKELGPIMFMDRAKNFVGQNFWARGYYVSTVGRDEEQIRNYIRQQEKEDKRLDQLKMFD